MPSSELTEAVREEPSEVETAPPQSPALLRWLVTYKFDLLLLLAATASLLASCATISPKKPFWNDELFTWTIINDPSARHMLSALRRAVDGQLPLFYLTGRAWAVVFGGNEIGLRLFTSVGFCVALMMLWWTMRRYFGTIATAFGLLTVWCTSDLFLFQNSEARTYGFFCAAVALTVAIFGALAECEYKLPLQLGVLTVLSQVLLAMSHLHGIVYGGMTLVALVAWDLLHRRLRPAVYGVLAMGWLALVPWLPAIWRLSQLGKPYGWIPPQSLSTLSNIYSFHLPLYIFFLFLALAAVGVLLSSGLRGADDEAIERRRSASTGGPLLALAITYLAVPLLAYVGSLLGSPVFERYMLPSSIGAAVLLALMAETLLRQADFRAVVPLQWKAFATFLALLVCAVFFLGLILNPVLVARDMPTMPLPSVVETRFPAKLPVVAEHVYDFMSLTHYSRRPERPYYFVVDLETATDPRAPRDQLLLHKQSQLWKDNGYLADRTLTTSEFLCSFDQFVVLHYPGLTWYEERIQWDPAFESLLLDATVIPSVGSTVWTSMLDRRAVLLVRRKPGVRPAVCR